MTNQETAYNLLNERRLLKKLVRFEVEYKEKPTFKFSDDTSIQSGKSLKNWIGSG